ncbi:MAG: family 78 glycoside hydrolase catalytic domain [Bacteroidales bacterium]|nr:family 78 glycoside hydrolase catalytic domain [Bacteroidales bacterium]
MKYLVYKLGLLILMTTFIYPAAHGDAGDDANNNNQIYDLTCEYKTNPLGIDETEPRFSWKISPNLGITEQTAYQIRAAENKKELTSGKQLIWNTEKVQSGRSIHIPYGGPGLRSGQRVYWQVRIWDQEGDATEWSSPAYFEMGLLSPQDWKAEFITPNLEEDTTEPAPSPYLRNEFTLNKSVRSARAYVTSLGLYEFHINGEKVGDQVFTPGWTSYNHRLPYQTYDVTSRLQKGTNAIGAILGDGWYRGYLGWGDQRNVYGNKLALLVQLEITFKDGTKRTFVTDNSWKASHGPIKMSDIYNGETYDARNELTGWDEPDFQDAAWANTTTYDYPKENLFVSNAPPVRKVKKIEPREIIYTPEGDTVFDMGQNMVGWIRLNIKSREGNTIRLKHAEVLDKEGNLYTENLRSADQCVEYTFKGASPKEQYEPHFTFQGFRYVAVSGLDKKPSKDMLTGMVIHSDMERIGDFECSNDLINQLQHNIQWGQRGNFLEVPTDCPQRDERLGWTGDAQVFAQTGSFNFNTAGFFDKWLKDLELDQKENGAIPHVVPDVLGGAGAAGWGDAGTIVPWAVYTNYGDQSVLENQYSSMKRWVEFMNRQAGKNHLWQGGSHFGDWLAFNTTRSDYPGATTYKDLIATAYFARSSKLLSKTAEVLGKENDAEKYSLLYEVVKKAFQEEFMTPNSRITSNTQTAYLLGLAFGLLPEEKEAKGVERLLQRINNFGHLTTGFLGTPLLCPTLSEYGETETAYKLLNRKEYPSWLYPVTMGATTIWERWDGIKPDSTFQDPGMNSFNHYAYGAIGEWLYRYVAGIEWDEQNPGYKHIIFKPHPGGGLTSAKASHESLYGEIISDWEINEKKFNYKVVIPPNTSASIRLPNAEEGKVTVNSGMLEENGGIHNIRQEKDKLVIDAKPGTYRFVYPYQKKGGETEAQR